MSLYKYLPPQRIDIIENGKIRFTQPVYFNDPFDTNPNIVSMADDSWIDQFLEESFREEKLTELAQESLEAAFKERGLSISKKHPLYNILLQQIKQETKSLGPNLMRDAFQLKFPGIREALFNALNNSIGILSLTEKPDNMLMWSHYADSHKGFVIELNEKHGYFDQRKKEEELQGHIRKVHYQKHRPQIKLYESSLSDDENRDIWIEKFIWFKSIEWEYEQEWRMIYSFKDKKDIVEKKNGEVNLFPLPLDCITGIIFGCKMSDENKVRFINLIEKDDRYKHIKKYQAYQDDKESQMNISEFVGP